MKSITNVVGLHLINKKGNTMETTNLPSPHDRTMNEPAAIMNLKYLSTGQPVAGYSTRPHPFGAPDLTPEIDLDKVAEEVIKKGLKQGWSRVERIGREQILFVAELTIVKCPTEDKVQTKPGIDPDFNMDVISK